MLLCIYNVLWRGDITKEQTKAGHVTQLGECLYNTLKALSLRVTSSRSAPAMQDCPKNKTDNNKLPKIGLLLAQTEEFEDKNILNGEAGPSKSKQANKKQSDHDTKALFLALLLLERSKGV